MENLGKNILDDRHCSLCKNYESVHQFMYCKYLKRRITARKKPCKHYDDDTV